MLTFKRSSFAVLLVLISSSVLWAGRLDKAFEALAKHDYFKAKELFEKSLKNEPMLSNYGLSVIFSLPNNPFYQLDSAYVRIVRSEKAYPLIKEKDLKKIIEETRINFDSLNTQKQGIASLILDRAEKEGTVSALEEFIDKYKFSTRMPEAIQMRDQLAFSIASEKNTWQAYKEFVDKYPNAPQASRAIVEYDKLLYQDKTKGGTIEQYATFVAQYPKSPFVSKAQDKIFELAVPNKTLEQYSLFVKKYPNSPYIEQAWKDLYNLWFTDFSQQRVDEFRKQFANSPMEKQLQDDLKDASLSFFPILSNKQYGFVSSIGKVVVQPEYDFVDDFSSRVALVGREDKISYVDTRGNLLCGFVYDDGMPFKGGLAVVIKGGLYGVINKVGAQVLPTKYDDITLEENGFILTEKDGVFEYFNRLGEPMLLKFAKAEPFVGQYAVVRDDNDKAHLINFQGINILSKSYNDIKVVSDSTFFVKDSLEKWSYIDIHTQALNPKKYDQVGRFSSGLAAVAVKETYGYINEQGKEVIPVKLSLPSDISLVEFISNRAKTSYRGKYGMIDKKGGRILPNLFDALSVTDNFPVPVSKSGLWGYADKNFNIAIQCAYDSAEPFTDGRAVVVKKGQWGVINAKGVIVIPLKYSSLESVAGTNLYIVSKDGKSGLIDVENNIVLPLEYERIRFYKDGVLQLVKDDKFLYYDSTNAKFIYQP